MAPLPPLVLTTHHLPLIIMAQPKFIITDKGVFRLGMVTWHRDLLLPGEYCYGGGYYEFDFVSNRLILTGESTDFGRPRWEWIEVLRVPAVYRGLRIIYVPRSSWEDDFCVSDELKVEYTDEAISG